MSLWYRESNELLDLKIFLSTPSHVACDFSQLNHILNGGTLQ